jgi:hypothetical protein
MACRHDDTVCVAILFLLLVAFRRSRWASGRWSRCGCPRARVARAPTRGALTCDGGGRQLSFSSKGRSTNLWADYTFERANGNVPVRVLDAHATHLAATQRVRVPSEWGTLVTGNGSGDDGCRPCPAGHTYNDNVRHTICPTPLRSRCSSTTTTYFHDGVARGGPVHKGRHQAGDQVRLAITPLSQHHASCAVLMVMDG